MAEGGGRATRRWGRRSSDPWGDKSVIRATLFSDELFARHAVSLADTQIVVEDARPVVSLLSRLEQNSRMLVRCYDALVADVAADRPLTPAAEWLIDNFHAVEEHIRQIRKDLPHEYFAQLPKLGPGFLEGHPRIFGIMWAYVAHTDSHFDPDQLGEYIRAYETRKALTLGELWAVAINLRILLLENVRRVAERLLENSRARQRADRIADKVLGIDGTAPAVAPALDKLAPAELSRPFLVQLQRRLTEHPGNEPLGNWIAQGLRDQGLDPEEAVQAEHQTQAQATVTMRNIFRSLRLLSDVNWEDWLESVSLIEHELRTNPTYPSLDFQTRNLYRSAVEQLARGSGQQEIDVTRAALTLARTGPDDLGQDVGYWLIDRGRAHLEELLDYLPSWREGFTRFIRRAGLPGYIGVLTIATGVLVALVLWVITAMSGQLPAWWMVLLAVFSILPLSDFALGVINYRVARTLHALPLPALALRAGVPDDLRTLVVVPTMLTSADSVAELMETLEVHFLANDNGELYFAGVTDWGDSDTELSQDDQELVDLAVEGIQALNTRYGDRFFLFHRSRRWNPAEGVWMGWERKRGKLEELNAWLRGAGETSYTTVEGRIPGRFRYVLTLDADTILPREAGRRLVGKLAHPLNQARFDAGTGRVVRGYSILQPRVSPSLPPTEDTSFFQKVYSQPGGMDPYAFAVSDVYQDLFHEGSFAGKGIYDIDALTVALEDRIPVNSVLSHDLLEGNYARSGLVTDVEVVEEYPTSYEVDTMRTHRWTRGDWQLLPWILGRWQGLSPLGLWKMTDNLRRSLSPIFGVAGFVVALALLPAPAAAVWFAIMVATFVVPPILPILPALLLQREDVTKVSQLSAFFEDLGQALVMGLMNLSFLAHRAVSMADAILRTLWRLLVSHRHLLEWTTAAAAQKQAKGTLQRFATVMALSWVVPVAALAVAAFRSPDHLVVAALPSLLWFLAPVVAWRASLHYDRVEVAATPEDLGRLRLVARRTWHFFETFATPQENSLPPDNFQEDPAPVVAHRTSPTNIGLYLLSVISARDFGWIGLAEAVDRLEATVKTVASLEHHHGHLFNWYDTRSLKPLEPRYISTVDSGNLVGHLLAVANTCFEWAIEPPIDQAGYAGIRDGLGLIRQTLTETGSGSLPDEVRQQISARLGDVEQVLTGLGDGHLSTDGLQTLSDGLSRLAALGGLPPAVRNWVVATQHGVQSLLRDATLGATDLEGLSARLAVVEASCRGEFSEADFGFLYDSRRQLLSIGYQMNEGKLDESCYDLLASEARLTSYLAIAKGDIPTRHWMRLGRSVTAVGSGAALLSWSGSMFEYLMPALVTRTPALGLLNTTNQRAVQRQQQYAAGLSVPWGISESGYNARDPELNYQYSPFGVPGLGIVRGLASNLVVAPYATGLAAMVEPADAADNYDALTSLGARGAFGFYEALDFTKARLPRDEKYAIVRSYMAHHQGMTIVSIHNVVHDGMMRERFHAEPLIRASELLLQERTPRDVPVSHARREELEPAKSKTVRGVAAGPAERTFSGPGAVAPGVHLMSNGTLSQVLTPSGGGQLKWRGLAITRWHPDLTTDSTGDFIYLRDERTNHLWSATVQPVRDTPDQYEVSFADDRARFTCREGSWQTTVEHHLSPEADAVSRRITVRNNSRQARKITVTSYAELALAPIRDDDAHPVFSRMFVYTEYVPSAAAIIATRRRRSPSDPEVWAAHFLVPEPAITGGRLVGNTLPETDRARFLGRNRSTRSPRQLDPRQTPSGTTGYVLDPIFSLTQQIEVEADDRVRLTFWTVVAPTRDEVLRLVDQHRAAEAHNRVTMLSWTTSQVQLRHLGIQSDEADLFQTLAGKVLFPEKGMRAREEALLRTRPQSDLWSLGISGDLPVVLVRIDDSDDIELVRQMVRAFDFWRAKRFATDLVLLNERATSYTQELQHELTMLAAGIRPRTGSPDSTGQVFVIRKDQAPMEAIEALFSCAAVVLLARRGDLGDQLAQTAPVRLPSAIERLPQIPAPPPQTTPHPGPELLYFNGIGGFREDGREYVTVIDPDRPTPAPWINVIANDGFGCHASAEGAGYTWWRNSRDNQLTPWRNDPVSAPVSEAVYVRDNATGAIGCATAAPVRGGRHVARHGFGYTRYSHLMTGHVQLEQTVYVAPTDPLKYTLLRLTNRSTTRRTLTVTSYAELVLGMGQVEASRHLITEYDTEAGVFLIRNPWTTQYPDQVVFVDHLGQQETWTGNRREFLGLHGTTELPQALLDGGLSGTTGPGLDPCAALQQTVALEPGESRDVVVLLGAGHDLDEVRSLVAKARETDPRTVLADARQVWQERLSLVQVSTPDPSFDTMMNGWLLYQTLACRMLARSGYYQASGAYGFRDQLQDSMAAVLVDPGLAREHIVRTAGRQFLEGDVQHWWLPATGAGIRTRISDDVVWLPYSVCRYLTVTGDTSILDESVPFLEGPVLTREQHENFFSPTVSQQTATVYEHCVQALQHAFRYGRHGLPRMGTGDWNDGMNRVGAGGEGESVWLGWFLHSTLTDFAEVARARGEEEFAAKCRREQERMITALETAGWDGEWYRRAYFDDSTPLGSAGRAECRIDGIAQSWAVLSGAADPERARQSMAQLDEQLVMDDGGIVRLFTPPFDVSEPDPGYIRAYPPGVRENGGQYTHGALWSIFAWASLGREDKAAATFRMINPISHGNTLQAIGTYRVEPYVVAADVYSVDPHVGRGGWTWYTGSAGWMYRAGLEAILGLRRNGPELVIDPCLPPQWNTVSARYRVGGSLYDIDLRAEGPSPRRVTSIRVNGEDTPCPDGVARLTLVDDGETHWVTVTLEGAEPPAESPENAEPPADD